MQKRPPLRIMRSVVFALVLREMRTRFGKHRLGGFWILFEPLLHLTVTLVMFGYVRGRTTPGFDFPVFLMTGIIPFIIFKNISFRIMDGIEANKGLFSYRQIKPIDTFVARVLVEVILYSLIYVLCLVSMALYGFKVTVHSPLEWLLILTLLVIFSFGFGIVLCVIGDYLPEAKIFIRLLSLPLYLLSGVVFPVWRLPEEILKWVIWNPVLHFIELVRHAIFDHYPLADPISFEYVCCLTLIFLFTGLYLYRYRRLELVAR